MIICIITGLAIFSNIVASVIAIQAREIGVNLLDCGPGAFRCADNSKCILDKHLCDYNKDCDDLSDETFSMCKKIQLTNSQAPPCPKSGQVHHPSHSCQFISKICSTTSMQSREEFRVMCDEIKGGLKPFEEIYALRKEESYLKDLFENLVTSFNETNWTKNDTACPPLYLNIDGKCVALFVVAKVTWSEAKQFCESISGTLGVINKMKDYESLLKYLRDSDLTSDFWIGGQFQSKPGNSSKWTWLNEQDIAMGAPFWGLYYSSNCTKRETSDYTCYQYSLTPRENRDGFCLAMDHQFHYYFSDQNCHEKKSPLCFLDEE